MKTPRKAMVLCAGFGTRLLPLTTTTPKPLMPLWGVPNLTHILRTLHTWGVRDVLLNLHHVPEPIWQYARSEPVPGIKINVSYEPEILGTGGALQKAAWFFDDDPTWIVNADILMELDPRPIIRTMANPKTIATLWLDDRWGPRTVECKRGNVATFRSAHPGRDRCYTFCGLHLVRASLLKHIPLQGFHSIIDAYDAAMSAGQNIHAHIDPQSQWCDLGTPEGLLQGHQHVWASRRKTATQTTRIPAEQASRQRTFRKQGARLTGFVAIGEHGQVGRDAQLHNAILMDNVRIGHHAKIHDAIVSHDVAPHASLTRLYTGIDAQPSEAVAASMKALGWTPKHPITAEHLAPRSSSRTFTRLRCRNASAMLVSYDPARIENTRYVGHAQFLARKGVRVPAVLLDHPQSSFTLFEDLGTRNVFDLGQALPPKARWEAYAPIVTAVADWHDCLNEKAVSRLTLEPRFDAKLYTWEHDLFCDHFLNHRLQQPATRIRKIRSELQRISSAMLAHPTRLVHRDLQSTNIYQLGTRKKPNVAFIDFQGMRLGSPYYDLASLLADPYVSMPLTQQRQYVLNYAQHVSFAGSDPLAAFWIATVQRLIQAIGAFARNARAPETARFADHIPSALRMLDRALRQLDNFSLLTDLIRTATHTDDATPERS